MSRGSGNWVFITADLSYVAFQMVDLVVRGCNLQDTRIVDGSTFSTAHGECMAHVCWLEWPKLLVDLAQVSWRHSTSQFRATGI